MTPRIGSAMPSQSQTCVVMDERFGHVAPRRKVEDALPTARRREMTVAPTPRRETTAPTPRREMMMPTPRRRQKSAMSFAGDADAGAGTGSDGMIQSCSDGSDSAQNNVNGEKPSFSPCTAWHSAPAWQNTTPQGWNRPASARRKIPALPRLHSLGGHECETLVVSGASDGTGQSSRLSDGECSQNSANNIATTEKPCFSPSPAWSTAPAWQNTTPREWNRPVQKIPALPRLQSLGGAQDTTRTSSSPCSSTDSDDSSSCSDEPESEGTDAQFDVPLPSARINWEAPCPRGCRNRAAWDYPLSKKEKHDRLVILFVEEEKAIIRECEVATARTVKKLTRRINELRLENRQLLERVASSRSLPERRQSVPPVPLNRLSTD